MALLAEQVVEEWLTREGYFTIRGLKIGNDELDLLAMKISENNKLEFLHVEVQVSLNPVSYISALTLSRQKEFNINGAKNATKRSEEQLIKAVEDWVEKKFFSKKKEKIRLSLSGGSEWEYLFVHGNVKSGTNELAFILKHGISLKSIGEVIKELETKKTEFTTNSATDIMNLFKFRKLNTDLNLEE